MWRLTQIRHEQLDGEFDQWTCQLISALYEDGALVLDLIPLEPRRNAPPGGATAPITIRVRHDLGTSVIADWAAAADVVALTPGRTGDRDWICLSAGDRHLVLELPGSPT